MPSRDVALACYRVLLRWAERAREVPFTIKRDHVRAISPVLADNNLALDSADSLRRIVRWSFKRDKDLKGVKADAAVRNSIQAVKMMNTQYGIVLREMAEKRNSHASREGIKYRIGEVVKDIRDDHKVVIVGWDRICKCPSEVHEMDISFVQPFYRVLQDEVESVRSSGNTLTFKYVAQEHMKPLDKPSKIQSNKIDAYFEGYSENLNRYIPGKFLRYEYPDNYEAEDVRPCDVTAADHKPRSDAPPTKPAKKPKSKKSPKRAEQKALASSDNDEGSPGPSSNPDANTTPCSKSGNSSNTGNGKTPTTGKDVVKEGTAKSVIEELEKVG